MKFNLTYGPDIANAPDGFKATVEAVAAFFESTFTDPVTINVKVERGLSGGLLGHSDYALTGPYTFAQITTALAQETHSGSDVIALAHNLDDQIALWLLQGQELFDRNRRSLFRARDFHPRHRFYAAPVLGQILTSRGNLGSVSATSGSPRHVFNVAATAAHR
jgi:hypothetical protein